MAELLVVRHAESTWNATRRWSGQGDPPLTPAGRDATRRLADELRWSGLTGVASSDLRRASETAATVAQVLDLPAPRRLAGLRESWTGLTRDEIERRWPGWLDRWRQEELAELPQAEHRDAFDARVLSALRELAGGSSAGDRLLVVGHAGTLRALRRHLGGVSHHDNLAGVWLAVDEDSIRRAEGSPEA